MTISDRYTLLTQPSKLYPKYTRKMETWYKLLILFCLFVFAHAKLENQNSLWGSSSFGRWPSLGDCPALEERMSVGGLLFHIWYHGRGPPSQPRAVAQWSPQDLEQGCGTSGLSASLWAVGDPSEPFLHKSDTHFEWVLWRLKIRVYE